MAQNTKNLSFHYDRWILFAAVGLIALGLVMVASASMVISDRQFNYPFHFFIRQSIYLVVGIFFAVMASRVNVEVWYKLSPYLLIISFLLLILVLMPGIGREVNGSKRWLGVGPIGLQVSELVKFCIIVYMAGYCVRREEEIRTRIQGFLKPMILLSIICGLLLLEPDFGACAVIMTTALAILFLAGVRLWQFLSLLAIVLAVLGFIAVAEPYRLARLQTFLHPWANQFDSGYQLTQSLIAFGRGGFFGVGLGNSIQKLFYLPEAHTDFLFAVLAEELGFIGELAVIGLFTLLVSRALIIGRWMQHQGKKFSAYLAWGFGLWIGLQAMINIGVNSGILPTKGLTLPLISYGGTSLVINCIVIGILLRIAYDAYS